MILATSTTKRKEEVVDDFDTNMEKNKRNEDRVRKERDSANARVLRDYKISRRGGGGGGTSGGASPS